MNALSQITDEELPEGTNRQVSAANAINRIINSYIILADQKASFLIAAGVAAPSFLLSKLPQGMGLATFVYFTSTALFILSVILAVAAIIPRIPMQGNGSVFWGDIASCENSTDYQSRFESSFADNKIGSEYATLNYHSARILKSKFRCLRFSIFTFVGGIALGTISTIMSRL